MIYDDNLNLLRSADLHVSVALKALRSVNSDELERYYYLAFPGAPSQLDYNRYLKMLSNIEKHLSKARQRLNVILVTNSLNSENK